LPEGLFVRQSERFALIHVLNELLILLPGLGVILADGTRCVANAHDNAAGKREEAYHKQRLVIIFSGKADNQHADQRNTNAEGIATGTLCIRQSRGGSVVVEVRHDSP
jgi:hypothetical protein